MKGKSIIITGGGSGIGAATALLGASRGARVTVADISEAGGNAVVKQIREAGGEAQFVRTDISIEADVYSLVAAATSAYGRLDAAFNNAGAPPFSYQGKDGKLTFFADMSLEVFRRNLEINVIGTFLCMKAEIAVMLENGGGSIINTSSCAGILATMASADYVTSKHAVIGLTKSAALDYATRGIRVNAILPGVTQTPMVETTFAGDPKMVEWAADMQPNKRLGLPTEIGEAALWLMSDAASLVTGISMPVDGGFSMV